MFRSNFYRGMVALVFAAALMLAGARPAAAEGLGWREALDWLGRIWGGLTLQAAPQATGDCGPEIDPNGRPCPKPGAAPDPVPGDCGPEIDPDGRCRS